MTPKDTATPRHSASRPGRRLEPIQNSTTLRGFRASFPGLGRLGLPMALGVLLVVAPGCGGGGGSTANQANVPAPLALAYGTSSLVWAQGVALEELGPVGGDWQGAAFTVQSALPLGLHLDPATGRLSGTPVNPVPTTTFTVTVSKGPQTGSATLELTIHAPSAVPLSYASDTLAATRGVPLADTVPTGNAWAGATFRITPRLPDGLDFDPATGRISGTPKANAGPASYAVLATRGGHGGETAVARFTLHVVDPAQLPLRYIATSLTGTVGVAIAELKPADAAWQGASFSVHPALPDGLHCDPHTGRIHGMATAAAAGAAYQVTASRGTAQAEATITITINDVAFQPLVYGSSTLDATVGIAIAPVQRADPAWNGATFTVLPALPAGLDLDPTDGRIFGVPSAPAHAATHTVTARLGARTASATLTITVTEVPLRYPATSYDFQVGQAILPLTRLDSAWDGATFTVAPALPGDLRLNADGGISGTPNAPAPMAVYVVTAQLGARSAGAALLITVNDATFQQPLRYPATNLNFQEGQAIPPFRRLDAAWDGATFTVAPALPGNLLLNADGSITGTPTGPAAPATYLVTARLGARTARFPLTITIQGAARPLLYSQTTLSLRGGEDMVPVERLDDAWDGARFTIAPALPTGLSMSQLTGILRGRPSVRSDRQDYTVTATKPSGSTTAVLSIAVDQGATVPITIAPFITADKTLQQASVPDQGPGVSFHWTVFGGVITDGRFNRRVFFTAGEPGPLRVEVLISRGTFAPVKSTGTATVVAPPVATIELPRTVHPRDRALQARVPNHPGHTYHWSFVANTCGAAIRAGADGATATLDTGDQEGTFTLAVNVQNQAADHATTQARVRVERGVWVTKDAVGSAEVNLARISATVLADGRVLVAGGEFPLPGAATRTLVAAAINDPATNRWTDAGLPLNRAFTDHSATRLGDNTVLLVGTTAAGASVKQFDPATGAWTDRAALGTARRQHTATLVDVDVQGVIPKVLVVGGIDSATQAPLRSAEIFDPAANVWHALPGMHWARRGHTATLLGDGTVLVAGGDTGEGRTAEICDPSLNTWTLTGNMTTRRVDSSATLLAGGEVLVAGGTGVRGNTSELFHAGTWTRVPHDMDMPRHLHTAVKLDDNRVLIAGGRGDSAACVERCLLFDPATQEFTATGALQGNRIGHAAVLLPDFTVLAVGGLNANTASERYMRPDALGAGGGAGGNQAPPPPREGTPTLADWQELELAPGASWQQVRAAYRRLSLLWHPNRHAGGSQADIDAATVKFAAIGNAYDRIRASLGH